MKLPVIIVVCGPTASGKSALALRIAQAKNGIIINADSQQMYNELAVLTARPTREEEEAVPHRLYGALPGHVRCSAGQWLQMARMEIDWARADGKTPVVTGGTGLYLKALTEGIAAIPDIPPEVRAQAKSDREAMGAAAFHARLAEVDPILGAKLKPGDTQRCLRAWEVWLGSGKPLSWWQQQGGTPLYPPECFEIIKVMPERAELYARCDARFDMMLKAGAMEEVRALLSLRLAPDLPVMKVIGVPELSACIRGEIPLEEAAAHAKQATRNYAKRQYTWFRNQLKNEHIQ